MFLWGESINGSNISLQTWGNIGIVWCNDISHFTINFHHVTLIKVTVRSGGVSVVVFLGWCTRWILNVTRVDSAISIKFGTINHIANMFTCCIISRITPFSGDLFHKKISKFSLILIRIFFWIILGANSFSSWWNWLGIKKKEYLSWLLSIYLPNNIPT